VQIILSESELTELENSQNSNGLIHPTIMSYNYFVWIISIEDTRIL